MRPGRAEDDGLGPTERPARGASVLGQATSTRARRVRDHVEAVDDWLGKLMDEVPDDTAGVRPRATTASRSASTATSGAAAPTSHRLLLRDPVPDPPPERARRPATTSTGTPPRTTSRRRCSRSWASRSPGKMDGEDLTALFDDVDQEDLPDRPNSITAVGSQIIVRDHRWLMVADRERIGAAPVRRRRGGRRRHHALRRRRQRRHRASSPSCPWPPRPWRAARSPSSARTARCARRASTATTTPTTTASRTTSTPFDNEHPEDDVTKTDLQWDGRDAGGRHLPPAMATP